MVCGDKKWEPFRVVIGEKLDASSAVPTRPAVTIQGTVKMTMVYALWVSLTIDRLFHSFLKIFNVSTVQNSRDFPSSCREWFVIITRRRMHECGKLWGHECEQTVRVAGEKQENFSQSVRRKMLGLLPSTTDFYDYTPYSSCVLIHIQCLSSIHHAGYLMRNWLYVDCDSIED